MRYALFALGFLVLTLCSTPSTVHAEAVQPTFSFNGGSENITFSGGEVSIAASFPEEVYVTRFYICEVSAADCTGSNYTRRYDVNATTTEAIKEWDGKNNSGLGPAGGTEFLVTVRYYDYSESSEAIEVDSPITVTLSENLVVNSLTHGNLAIEEEETYRRSDFTSVSTSWTFNFYSPIEGPNTQALYFIFKGTFGDVSGESAVNGENYTYTNQRWRPGNNIIGKTMSGIDPLGGFDAQSGTYSILLAKSNNPSGVAEWFFSGGASGTEPEIHDTFTFGYLAEDVVEDLGSITSLGHGGVTIDPDEVVPVDTTFSETNYWTFTYSWPNSVTNLNAMFLIFRGEIGALDGDPVEGENYDTTNQSWVAGDNVKSQPLTLASFANGDAPEGKYTAVVFEKNVKDQSIDTDEFATWFFTNGEEGKAPLRYRTMTFTYGRHLEECCSSVVFFPGMQGSVLKSGSDTYWPSDFFGGDLPNLALNEDGSSKSDIYVDGILNTYSVGAFSFDVYQPFTTFMNALVANEDDDINILAWHPFPYDWRYSPEQVIADGVTTASGVIDVLDAIEEYAYDSATGKVILVGHSMGGLFGKAVIKALEDAGKADLVESFVMVGTPQLGTPQTAASLLHGFIDSFGQRMVALNPGVMRSAALTIPSAYNLLPSSEYFNRVSDPVIVFDENASFTKDWRDLWGTEITTYLDFFAFVTGGGVARIEPAESQTRIPAILDPNLTFDANTFHDTYDTYDMPDGIRTVEIGGWGRYTIKGLKYKTRRFQQYYEPLFTLEGDKTVVYPSALAGADEQYFLNLQPLAGSFNHLNLLSISGVQDSLKLVIEQLSLLETSYLKQEKPSVNDLEDQLLVSSHSPVFFGAYDEEGNFTGIDPDQNYSEDLMIISKEIPGSDFIVVGENQYIFLPKEGTYTFVYFGHDEGFTTIEISNVSGDDFTQLYTFTDIDTASTTQARFSISTNDIQGIVIEVDYDGDDTYELEVFSDQEQPEPVEEEPTTSSGGGGGGSPAGGGPTALSGNNPFEFIVTFTPPQPPAPTQSSNNTSQPPAPSTASNPSSVPVDTQTVTPAPTPTAQPEQPQPVPEQQSSESGEQESVTIVTLNNTEQLATAAQKSWYDWLITMIFSVLQWIKNFILNLF